MAKTPNTAATGDKAKAKATAAVAVIPQINSKALSKDVGPYVAKNWNTANTDEEKADALRAGAQKKKYLLLASMTEAIVKAAKNDKSIDLKATVMQGPEGTKAMAALNDQLNLALGFKEVVSVTKGNTTTQKLVWASSIADLMPKPGEKDSRKDTLRSNLSHAMKKCAMGALAINERNITAKVDKAEGTLLLSGPSIKKEFGQDKVLLNEKQKIPGKKEGQTIELKAKPSFTAIADMAASDHGKELRRGSNTRGKGGKIGSGTTVLDSGAVITQLADSVVKACERIKEPTEVQQKQLERMADAIAKVLEG